MSNSRMSPVDTRLVFKRIITSIEGSFLRRSAEGILLQLTFAISNETRVSTHVNVPLSDAYSLSACYFC